MFTGDITGGGVHRRIFDVSNIVVTTADEEEMENRHRGVVSAICHLEDMNMVISGNTFGDVCINDHDNGNCILKFGIGDDSAVGSITRCPLNPELFMVGRYPHNEILVYDVREDLTTGKPSLVLRDAVSMAVSRY
ncbi:hypothetical protein LPJ53_006453, partial [Coemansia erecta]